MFNLNASPTFKASVPLSVPGLKQPLEVEFTFRHKGRTALQAWLERWVATPTHEVLDEVIEGWGLRRDGEPVPYSVSALAELLETYTPASGEISDAYLIELSKAKRKN